MKVGIVGAGALGTAVHRLYSPHHDVFFHDPPKGINNDCSIGEANYVLICVPTPPAASGHCDTSIVEAVVSRIPSGIDIVCHSTLAIGTTDRLNVEYGRSIVYAPAYFGETPNHRYAELSQIPFVILGGYEPAVSRTAELVKSVYPSKIRIRKTEPLLAEVVKYMENSFLAVKVAFCNEMYDLVQQLGLDYDEARDLWLLDDRIGASHTQVHRHARGFGGKCLPKDTLALDASARDLGVELPVIQGALRSNARWYECINDCDTAS